MKSNSSYHIKYIMDQAVKQILNSLHCPLCQSQIDIRSYPNNSKGDMNYACVSDLSDYQIHLATHNALDHPFNRVIPPFIDKERVIIFDNKYMYEITQYSYHNELNTGDSTQVCFFNLDEENRIIFVRGKERAPLYLMSKLFDFQQTNREKIIKRIKTILTFQ